MTKPILVIQFRKSPTLEHEQECIAKSFAYSRDNFVFTNIADAKPYIPTSSDLEKYSALVIGGSSEYNITDWPTDLEKKANKLKPFLQKAIDDDFPTLGICFGHQLIAHFFGGIVKRDPEQAEGGIVQIEVFDNALIFNNMPAKVFMVSGHKDSVTKLPKGAIQTAKSQKTKIAGYKIKENIFCVQFHPELDLEALVWRLSLFPEYTKGRSIEEIKRGYQQMPYAKVLFENFKKVIG